MLSAHQKTHSAFETEQNIAFVWGLVTELGSSKNKNQETSFLKGLRCGDANHFMSCTYYEFPLLNGSSDSPNTCIKKKEKKIVCSQQKLFVNRSTICPRR